MKNAFFRLMAYIQGCPCVGQNITYIIGYVSKVAFKQYIMPRNTLNSNLDRSNLRERCEFTAERCCLSLNYFGGFVPEIMIKLVFPHFKPSKTPFPMRKSQQAQFLDIGQTNNYQNLKMIYRHFKFNSK